MFECEFAARGVNAGDGPWVTAGDVAEIVESLFATKFRDLRGVESTPIRPAAPTNQFRTNVPSGPTYAPLTRRAILRPLPTATSALRLAITAMSSGRAIVLRRRRTAKQLTA